MSSARPDRHYSPEPNVLERKAAAYLQERVGAIGERERRSADAAALRGIQRWAIVCAVVAGVVSGGAIGGVEVFVRRGLLGGMEDLDWREQLPYWAGFWAFAGLISAIEILFLYWIALRATARISRVVGNRLNEDSHSETVAMGLARAALEFPNPQIRIYGIDPYARMPDWRITARAILYRMKVGISSFVLRVLLRRVVGRMALRGLIPLFTGPLYAVWNAVITWRIVREARIRAVGPFVVEGLIRQLAGEHRRLRPCLREIILHGTGEAIMRGHDAHPNHVLLLARLVETFDIRGRTIDADWPGKRRELPKLSEPEQSIVLDALTLASLLGSKVSSDQEAFLAEVHADCGFVFRRQAMKRLQTRLLDGECIGAEALRTVRAPKSHEARES